MNGVVLTIPGVKELLGIQPNYNITGETQESLMCLIVELSLRPGTGFKLSPLSRVFLFMTRARCYPTFAALATMFDISTAIVQFEIRK